MAEAMKIVVNHCYLSLTKHKFFLVKVKIVFISLKYKRSIRDYSDK